MIAFMAVTMLGTPLLLWILPDQVTVKIGDKSWALDWCGLIDHAKRELFVVHLQTHSTGRAPTHTWMAVLDPGTGKVIGEHVQSDPLMILGFDGGRMWVREPRPGALFDDRDFVLSLPGLQNVTPADPNPPKLERLFLGNCNSPRAPRKLGSRLVLDGKIVCDNRTKKAVDLGGGDRLLAHQTLQGEPGKLILTRLDRQGKVVWSLDEKAWAGQRGLEKPGFRVAWASRVGKCVVLVLPLHASSGALRLACLDPERGRLTWRRGP